MVTGKRRKNRSRTGNQRRKAKRLRLPKLVLERYVAEIEAAKLSGNLVQEKVLTARYERLVDLLSRKEITLADLTREWEAIRTG